MYKFVAELLVDEQTKHVAFETEEPVSEETAILLAGVYLAEQTQDVLEYDIEFVELEFP